MLNRYNLYHRHSCAFFWKPQVKHAQTFLAEIILMCETVDIVKLSIEYQRKEKVGQETVALQNLKIDVIEKNNGRDVQCHLIKVPGDGRSVKVMAEDASLVSGR